MKLVCLCHVPFEGPANIAAWARNQGFELAEVHLYRGDPFPAPEDFDWLVVMGGPMSVHDENVYSWLKAEKRFVREAIDNGAVVVGVCLGAQILAELLGGDVTQGPHREIGWFPVHLTGAGHESPVMSALSAEFTAFHWHGEVFSAPPGCEILAESDACKSQAFLYDNRVLALQYHLESTEESVELLLKNGGGDIDGSRYTQTAEDIREGLHNVNAANEHLAALLDRLKAVNS